ncbi:MAG: hypothetical protein PHW62_00640 [Candidatus Ratteibacteria bacterium]|nr:hypothetical protein [Candidatus Ratteibacteria bacterium]
MSTAKRTRKFNGKIFEFSEAYYNPTHDKKYHLEMTANSLRASGYLVRTIKTPQGYEQWIRKK